MLFIRFFFSCVVLLVLSCRPAPTPFDTFVDENGPAVDLWIHGGRLLDGQDSTARLTDLLVRGDSIAFIGEVDGVRLQPARTIEADGRLVTPGFIDTHAHGDPLATPNFTNFLAQGVTTICLGQDGRSPATEDLAAWMQAGFTQTLDAGCGCIRNSR